MITISGKSADTNAIKQGYPENGIEREIVDILSSSQKKYDYELLDQLKFELGLRNEIVKASDELYNSGLEFQIFRKSTCNPEFWNRSDDGGFELRKDVKASDAIRDIFTNGSLYGTECATAMIIIYYKALLEIFHDERFNKLFPEVRLMNWHSIDRLLEDVGLMKKAEDYLPGDRRYFANPDVNSLTPEWQGENVIDFGNGTYYGHGIGEYKADVIIDDLNKNREEGAEKTAYLMDRAGRPDFKNLANIYLKSALAQG
jgi:protein-glutamine gamma-glutamyltransferase